MPKPASVEADGRVLPLDRTSAAVPVWDPIVRIFHWSLVLAFLTAWFSRHHDGSIHQVAGYCAVALVAVRAVWGAIGTPYARFSQFVRHPATVFGYLRDMLNGREVRYLGHNPAGGAMIVVLMTMIAATAATGWMMTTDAYFGVHWVGELHEFVAHVLVLLVLFHVGGVLVASFRHRENLVAAMITGRKRQVDAN